MQYLKVMFDTRSSASGYIYKIGEVNVAQVWNPNETDPQKMGGFNFSTEDKILRFLVRGDTLYDVTIPSDAEVIDCPSVSAPHGVFRSNKIIITNPRRVDDEMAMDFYLKSNLPERSYFKAMAGCAVRGYIKTALKILLDKVDANNIDLAIAEFEDFCTPADADRFEPTKHLRAYTKIIYHKLIDIKQAK